MREVSRKTCRRFPSRTFLVAALVLALPSCVDLSPPWEGLPATGGSTAGGEGGASAIDGGVGGGAGGSGGGSLGGGGGTSTTSSGGQGGAKDAPLATADAADLGDASDAPLGGSIDAADASDVPSQGGAGGVGGAATGGTTGSGGKGGSGGSGGSTGAGGAAGGGGAGGTGAGGSGIDAGSGLDAGSVCVGRPASTGGAGGISDGLIAYYTCDQTAGPGLTDQLGKNNGTLASGAGGTGGTAGYSFGKGKVGSGALVLSAANKGYATFPKDMLDNVCDITVATWVNLATIADWERIFDFGRDQNVYMYLTARNANTSKVRFAISLTGFRTGEQSVDGQAALPVGSWTHVAIVLGASGATLYVDGKAVGTSDSVVLRPADLGASLNSYLGRSEFASDPYFDGSIDDFRIYNRALAAGEIQTLAGM